MVFDTPQAKVCAICWSVAWMCKNINRKVDLILYPSAIGSATHAELSPKIIGLIQW